MTQIAKGYAIVGSRVEEELSRRSPVLAIVYKSQLVFLARVSVEAVADDWECVAGDFIPLDHNCITCGLFDDLCWRIRSTGQRAECKDKLITEF